MSLIEQMRLDAYETLWFLGVLISMELLVAAILLVVFVL